MSGHSKWATIRRSKAKTDAARGRVFTRLIREITIAARTGGNPEANPRLRQAVAAAKAASMPSENIKKAIQRGTGELPGVTYEEVTYEAYGPGGVALMLNIMTDNKNRTVSEIRHIFSRRGGNLAETGAVTWMFERKGVITIDPKGLGEDSIMELALEAGAEDIKTDNGNFDIITASNDFEKVKQVVEKSPVGIISAEITMVPKSYVRVEGEEARKLLKLLEEIEAHDDIQNIYGNFDIDEKMIEAEG
jgi:YebC/PmpR family DNA-binding regulatory protein